MSFSDFLRRTRALLAAAAMLGVLASCDWVDDVLAVDNPEEILEEDLDDPALVNMLVNSVIGEFQSMYDEPLLWYATIVTDETVSGINWEAHARMSQRVLRHTESPANTIFAAVHRARAAADTMSGRLRTLLDSPNQDLRLARTLAYAGYTYVFLGEMFCESTINVGATRYSPAQLSEMALDRFTESIQISNAAVAAGASAVVADSMLNFARVGAARAALQLGRNDVVIQHASQVPEDFVFWSAYSENSAREYNSFQGFTTGANQHLGVHPNFRDLDDPRIPHAPDFVLGHNQLTELWRPYQPMAFSGWGPGVTALFTRSTYIRLASGIEARHHLAEAEGPTAATLAFVNERRAVGNQDSVDLAGDELMAELREQRARDLFMGGFRLGDLRRWKAQGVGDFFPSGPHPVSQWGNYGDLECFPIPQTELDGNPNL